MDKREGSAPAKETSGPNRANAAVWTQVPALNKS
jgi:hypothetical protein